MKARDYLNFVGKIKGLRGSELKKAVDDSALKTKTDDVMDRPIGNLSKGYKQRIGLAQAIINSPPLLILDEPTIGLDPTQVVEFRDLIKGLAGEHTILLSTHILPEASLISDRVLIINKGKIVAEDTPDELASRVKGTQTLRVGIKGAEEEEIIQGLKNIEGVDSVMVSSDNLFLIEVDSDKDISPDIARFVVTFRNWDLTELTPVGISLEDIFMSLVTKEEV